MLGVMLTTSFLSMWISNTATTAMMVPIVEAVLGEIKNDNIKNQLEENKNSQVDEVGSLTILQIFLKNYANVTLIFEVVLMYYFSFILLINRSVMQSITRTVPQIVRPSVRPSVSQ